MVSRLMNIPCEKCILLAICVTKETIRCSTLWHQIYTNLNNNMHRDTPKLKEVLPNMKEVFNEY